MGIHYIIDDFKGCGKYVPVFPADAISEGDPIFVIERKSASIVVPVMMSVR